MKTAIQATFSGYGGLPCTLFSAYDQERRILVIAKEAKFRDDRHENCVVITNDPAIPRDTLFVDDDMKPAIAAFYALQNGVSSDSRTARLTYADSVQRANPEGSIERDGIDTTGPRYRISDSVTCLQIAALATCLYAFRADSVEQSVVMAERLSAIMMGGGILTI